MSSPARLFFVYCFGIVVLAWQDTALSQMALGKPPAGSVRLSKDHSVWMVPKQKIVIVDGKVAMRKGPLEMFACPQRTKEHESIVAVSSPARYVHAGLLAIGAKVGNTVQYAPYKAARGTTIDVSLYWRDKSGKLLKANAQEWIRHTRTGKQLSSKWVFAGSGHWVDEAAKKHYLADQGELICISNFSTAMMDLPVASSSEANDLLFEAFTERIPTVGTEVRMVLKPRLNGVARHGNRQESQALESPAPRLVVSQVSN